MYRIAICDNDVFELNIVVQCVKKYFEEHAGIDGEICSFVSSEELEHEVEDRQAYDLYLLDILMPNVDGIALGRAIRKHSGDAPIVYITSTKEFAFEAFGVCAMQYITKPLSEDKLIPVLDRAYTDYRKRPRHPIELKSVTGLTTVAEEDIMYIENRERIATYAIADGTSVICSRTSGSFEDAIEPIPADPGFIQPHKSFFVNMKYIRDFHEDMLTMDDNREIPVNRKRLTAVRHAYLAYVSEMMGDTDQWK